MTEALSRRRMMLTGGLLALLPGCARAQPGRAAVGDFRVQTAATPRRGVRVTYFVPPSAHRDSPILVALHGRGRDADAYLQAWMEPARRAGVIVLAPEFDEGAFEGVAAYNLGGVQDGDGDWRPPRLWSFGVVDAAFDAFVARTGSRQTRFSLYGHSAGAQFVHRYLLFTPADRVARAVAANAGWYTLPTRAMDFPYGLRGAPVSEAGLRAYLGKPLTVLLGGEDDETGDDGLRTTAAAMRQGPHRLARGRTFVETARRTAAELGAPLAWRLQIAQGVGHDHAQMARAAAPVLLPAGPRLAARAG